MSRQSLASRRSCCGGGDWFRALGKTEAGTKLYCISGHVERPGTYELPLGVSLDELVECAGGYIGTLKAFSPGGASSGFLPASMRDRPLDFKGLGEVGSMLGSAGVVVLNDTVDMRWAVAQQHLFFEVKAAANAPPAASARATSKKRSTRPSKTTQPPIDPRCNSPMRSLGRWRRARSAGWAKSQRSHSPARSNTSPRDFR